MSYNTISTCSVEIWLTNKENDGREVEHRKSCQNQYPDLQLTKELLFATFNWSKPIFSFVNITDRQYGTDGDDNSTPLLGMACHSWRWCVFLAKVDIIGHLWRLPSYTGKAQANKATNAQNMPWKSHFTGHVCIQRLETSLTWIQVSSMIVSACLRMTANPTARNEFSSFRVLLNASIWSWNMSWAPCERWAAETLAMWSMITISLILTIFVAKILSLRPGRPQIQPICWQFYWNAAYMIFYYATIIWRGWGPHLGHWLGTIAVALCEQNVKSFVESGGSLCIFVSWWEEWKILCQMIVDVNTVSLLYSKYPSRRKIFQ